MRYDRVMIEGIDHLVIACADPDAAAAELESALGIASTAGGRHERFGTHNRIAWLADGSYLELIGVTDATAAAASPVGAAAARTLEQQGGGLATYALRVDDLQAAVPDRFGPIGHGTRVRDDGDVVEWWTAFGDDPLDVTSPFLIQHAYSGAEWGATAMAERGRFVHPLGSRVALMRLDIAVDDPPSVATSFGDQLGLEVRAVTDLAIARIGPHAVRFVPRREMAVPAVVVLGADVASPRVADALGLRFDLEPVASAVLEPYPA